MSKHDKELLVALTSSISNYQENPELTRLGKKMASMKNDMGFPPDMFMDRMDYLNDLQKLFIGHIYCGEMIAHKRASGAGEKAIERTRKHNQTILGRLMRTGEMGEF